MNSFELNKILGAVLLAVAIITIVRLGTETLFASPSVAGLPAPEVLADSSTAKAKKAVPLSVLLKKASLDRGKRVAKKCASCHTFNKGGANRIGPNLWNVVGRAKGQVAAFNYSRALKAQKGKWDYKALDAFLLSPRNAMKGTLMSFAGLRKPEDRAAMILYLRSLADKPARLPK